MTRKENTTQAFGLMVLTSIALLGGSGSIPGCDDLGRMSPISTSLLKKGKKNTNKKHWQRLDDKYKTVSTQMKFKLLLFT